MNTTRKFLLAISFAAAALSSFAASTPLNWASDTTYFKAKCFSAFTNTFDVVNSEGTCTWSSPATTYLLQNETENTYKFEDGEPALTKSKTDEAKIDLGFEFLFGDSVYTSCVLERDQLSFGEKDALWLSSDIEYDLEDIRVIRETDAVKFLFGPQSVTLHASGEIMLAFDGSIMNATIGIMLDEESRTYDKEWNDSDNPVVDVTLVRRGLPIGLALDPDTGVLSGRPQWVGQQGFDVTVTDETERSLEGTFTLDVSEPDNQRPQILGVDGVPESGLLVLGDGDETNFVVHVCDPEGESMTVTLYVDGEFYECLEVDEESDWQATFSYTGEINDEDESRVHELTVTVSDDCWNERVSSSWQVRLRRDWYVDSDFTFTACEGDTVYVTCGDYRCLADCEEGAHVTFIATDFPAETRVKYGPCAEGTNVVFRGFTFDDCVMGGLYIDCTIHPTQDYSDWEVPPSGATDATLVNCLIYGGPGFGASYSTLYNCTVTDNVRGGIGDESSAYNSIIWTNGNVNVEAGSFVTNCVTVADPRLVDSASGDFRLRAGSPCLDSGDLALLPVEFRAYVALNGEARVCGDGLDIGASEECDPVVGYVIRRRVVGAGWLYGTVEVEAGETATIYFAGHPIDHVTVDGEEVQVEEGDWGPCCKIADVQADADLVAYFGPQDFYVDCNNGDDDENDGWTSDTAFETIERALREVADGETIYLAPGSYPPINLSEDRRHLRFVSLEGPNATAIFGDSDSETPCIVGAGTNRTTLVGICLDSGHGWIGGGASYATLLDCEIVNCTADCAGGGVYECVASNCVFSYNSIYCGNGSGYWSGGSAAACSTLIDCRAWGNVCEHAQSDGVFTESEFDRLSALHQCEIVGSVYAWESFLSDHEGSHDGLNAYACSGADVIECNPEGPAQAFVRVMNMPRSGSVLLGVDEVTNFIFRVQNLSNEAFKVRLYCDEELYSETNVCAQAGRLDLPIAYVERFSDVESLSDRTRQLEVRWVNPDGDEERWFDWDVCLHRDWYVDANTQATEEEQDGSAAYPYPDFSFTADEGDTVYVAAGNYESLGNCDAHATFIATAFPNATHVAYGPDSDETNAVYRGFTFDGCVRGGTYVDCTIHPTDYDPDDEDPLPCACGAVLVSCALYGGPGFGASDCTLYNCTVTDNVRGGIDEYCSAYNSIIWTNGNVNVEAGSFVTNCVTDVDPRLVDSANGKFRLRTDSPCRYAGDVDLLPEAFRDYPALNGFTRFQGAFMDIGACEAEWISGWVIRVRTVGRGDVDCAEGVGTGSNATLSFRNGYVDYITVEGVRQEVTRSVDGDYYTLEDVRADVTVVVYFRAPERFVDVTNGDDENDGQTRATAFATVARALEEAEDGSTIYLAPGTYPPIDVSDNGRRLRFESLEGRAVTVIDGGKTNRCVYGYANGEERMTTFAGLTLQNGYTDEYGGGAYEAVLTNCFITSCVARRYGGGAERCTLVDCEVASNRVSQPADADYTAFGGGLDECVAINCMIRNNAVYQGSVTNGACVGGGVSCSELRYCTVTGNQLVSSVADETPTDDDWTKLKGAGLYECHGPGIVYAWDNVIWIDKDSRLKNHADCATDEGKDQLKIYEYDPKESAMADIASVSDVFGEQSEVAQAITSEVQLVEFNAFLNEAGVKQENIGSLTLSDAQKQHAYASFQASALMETPQLLKAEPEVKVDEVAFDEDGNLEVTVSLSAGEETIMMAVEKLESCVRVGTSLDDINGKPDVRAVPAENGSTLTLTIAPPGETCGFIRVNAER